MGDRPHLYREKFDVFTDNVAFSLAKKHSSHIFPCLNEVVDELHWSTYDEEVVFLDHGQIAGGTYLKENFVNVLSVGERVQAVEEILFVANFKNGDYCSCVRVQIVSINCKRC